MAFPYNINHLNLLQPFDYAEQPAAEADPAIDAFIDLSGGAPAEGRAQQSLAPQHNHNHAIPEGVTSQGPVPLDSYVFHEQHAHIPSAPGAPVHLPYSTAPTPSHSDSYSPTPSSLKRKPTSDPLDEDLHPSSSRTAVEEDKRRRNTAASARFRLKKKEREQALEKTAKDMTDKVVVLEQRMRELEQENKWLKSLLIEKMPGVAAAQAGKAEASEEFLNNA
ncbi:hypothetical protein SAICODRAFT_69941 [Saitoella complicata NRRL Y-17804]|uniref:uncharacterized protein n=1 Tax=Saitoella complicata (strain BCRC 22490 / CBS 7301 / JCM 7358 / NBRC 10748 / NRRL Y-17804) TaxID=698492 RepID=UPI0008677DE7|nr:uncharacterized protein SAICODRAFT_69941 [Saitoella complicata NRRL Y-17804]ODQ54758.1 hypothetical protein SAICODRAFT_69941 [Saitoella complicata NRRL Y-17804]